MFNDGTVGHHDDPVATLRSECEIVGDMQDRRAVLPGKVPHQGRDLRAQRGIKHAGGLVSEDHRWPGHHGPGERDTLAFTAGELMREAASITLGVKTYGAQGRRRGFPSRHGGADAMYG